jgi:hypothetical protein
MVLEKMNHKGTEDTKKRERKLIPIITSYPVKTSVFLCLMERENEPQRHSTQRQERESQ